MGLGHTLKAQIVVLVLVSSLGVAGVAASGMTGMSPLDTFGLVDTSRGMWHLYDAGVEVATFTYANPGDYPFVGDWDCNGTDTPGLYRQSDGFAYLPNSNS